MKKQVRLVFKKAVSFMLLSFIVLAMPLSAYSAPEDESLTGQTAVAGNIFENFDPLQEGMHTAVRVGLDGTVTGVFTMMGTKPPEVAIQKDGSYRISYETFYQDPEFVAIYGERTHIADVVNNNVNALLHNPMRYSTTEFLAQDWNIKSANASSGTDVISPVKPVADFTRNIAYALLATVLVVIGIMIMFRQKIGGQMLVTIQNSIPRVLIATFLITISFPLVGLMIDFANIISGFIESMFEQTGIGTKGSLSNPFGLGVAMMWYFVAGSSDAAKEIIGGGAVASVILTVVGFPYLSIAMIVILIILLFIFWALAFRIWFMLLKTFGKIFLDVILLPLNMLIGAIPGNESAIPSNLKRVALNVMVFPVSLLLLKLALFIGQTGAVTFPSNFGLFTPGVNEITSVSGDEIFAIIKLNGLIMYGVLILIPQVPSILEEIFQVQAPKFIAASEEAASRERGKVPLIGGLIGGK